MKTPSNHLMRRLGWVWVFPLLAISAIGSNAENVPDPADTVRVELRDGRSFSGKPVGLRDGIVTIRVAIDRGEVERGFPADTVERLHFPDEEITRQVSDLVDRRELVKAIPGLEAMWRPRSAFIAILDPATMKLFAALPAAYLESGDLYRAIGIARRLLPHARGSATRNAIQEAILLGHYKLEMFSESSRLAREWIADQPPFPASALGWKILAQLALRDEDFERVIWVALQPIALADARPIPHIGDCYALAIHALSQQEREDEAALLYREMRDRGLEWPDDPRLADTGSRCAAACEVAAKTNNTTQAPLGGADAEPDLDLRPPEKDLNLPIQQVRKRITPLLPPVPNR